AAPAPGATAGRADPNRALRGGGHMKIKFTLLRPGQPPAALMATLDAGATVGDLAAHLDRADPARAAAGQGYPTGAGGRDRPPALCLVGPNVALDADRRIGDSGLHSGATVTLTYSPESYAAAAGDVVSATVQVLSGRDAGQVFRVRGS